MSKPKVLCYIVAYNASPFIAGVLDRIPAACWESAEYDFDVLISDDCSPDDTVAAARRYKEASPRAGAIEIQRTPHNLGYGGNQKMGYDYAAKHGYAAVILLHGDGQYSPEYLPAMIAPLLAKKADVVLGSRMIHKRDAIKGGMPWYKFFGNMVLTRFQNMLLGTDLSEFHTGLRAYGVEALSRLPYRYNSDGYVFDTEILIQHRHAGHIVEEIAIPTRYGEEVCHVNGVKYAWRVVKATLAYRMHVQGFSYVRQFDLGGDRYPSKVEFNSSHSFALNQARDAQVIADIGGGSGVVGGILRRQGKKVYGFDLRPADPEVTAQYDAYEAVDLDGPILFTRGGLKPDTLFLLDVLEHLREPEHLLYHLRDMMSPQSRVIITVPNVAFFTVRIKLLFGFFSYGSRGILDHTHLRFYTFSSIKALLVEQGYAIEQVSGIPAPFPLLFKTRRLADGLLKFNVWLIALHKGLFSFQIALIARPKNISHDS